MTSKTKLIPDYLIECTLDFDGISVKLAKVENDVYSITIDPGKIDLDRCRLPQTYSISGSPRIEVSMHKPSQDWFVPARVGGGDIHFKNGTKFNTTTINHILYNIQEGGKKLKQINEDNAIRFKLSNGQIEKYTFQGVDITITRKCNHLGPCENDCKYAISIDSDLKFKVPSDISKAYIKSPGSRGVLEGSCAFFRNLDGTFFLSRHINCEHGESISFNNDAVFTKQKLEYMLFSIKKTLDRMAELGYKVESKPVAKLIPKPAAKPETLEVMIAPIFGTDKVYLVVKGLTTFLAISDEYKGKEWCCYSLFDGDYRINHNGEPFRPKGIDGDPMYQKTSGNVMTPEAAKEIMTALGKCAQCLHEVNHPGEEGTVLKF
jgi:hypothetical protein